MLSMDGMVMAVSMIYLMLIGWIDGRRLVVDGGRLLQSRTLGTLEISGDNTTGGPLKTKSNQQEHAQCIHKHKRIQPIARSITQKHGPTKQDVQTA